MFVDISIIEDIPNVILPSAEFFDEGERIQYTSTSEIRPITLPDVAPDGSAIYSVTLTLSAVPPDYWKKAFLALHIAAEPDNTFPVDISGNKITIQFVRSYFYGYYGTIQNEIELANRRYKWYLWFKERNDKRERDIQIEEQK